MKKLLLTLLTFAALNSFAQKSDIPKGTDKIVVKNDKSAADNFLFVKQTLADKDIAIATQDKDIFQIRTGKITYNRNAYYILLFNCRNNQISITGIYAGDIGLVFSGITVAPSDYPIEYKGAAKPLFERVNNFAKLLGTTTYEYSNVRSETKPKNDDVYN